MTPAQWQRARDLFEQGLDVDPREVDAWLDHQPGADETVAAEVRSLLAHHSRAGQFLAEPVAGRVSHLLEDTPQYAEGSAVGPYAIVREVGRGGMGRVYLATDTRLGRMVALKALPPSLVDDPSQRERLRREARAAASLTHPGICTIYALEELGADVFIAAEYIDGWSLREEIARDARPTPAAVMATAQDLAAALASAHVVGITHRDLKPENVMRTRDGRLKILDFGLALIDPSHPSAPNQASPRVTQPGAFIGTPAYMAPEQLNGGAVDPRTDVFALGVLLYEYATGVHPFEAGTALALAARVLESDPRPIESLRPDLPPTLGTVIARCMRKSPSARYASAGEVTQALLAPTTIASSHVSGWWRHHQVVAIGLAFVAAMIAWRIKEWVHGIADHAFLVIGITATVAGILRGHLLFAERMNRASFDAERRRAAPMTMATDALMAVVLSADGLLIFSGRPLIAVLTIALAVGIALARLVVERSTTRGAFGED